MTCLYPRTVGFKTDGKTISWSQKDYSKEFSTFKLPCGQCIECRLDYARQWAVRCIHEAQMHPKNSFITLTYSDEKLTSPKLDYTHFQKFMKKLRKLQNDPMGVFVTGEYGEKNKRPHWHAIIFNYRPSDLVYRRSNDNGDRIYTSSTIDDLWDYNDPEKAPTEIGDVTFQSAGYCARYAAKKLVHGKDQEHEFKPISKKSNKNAIGKKWLEKYWPDVFNYGQIVLPDGKTCSIPRYYEKWIQKNQPQAWEAYVTQTKQHKITKAEIKNKNIVERETRANEKRSIRNPDRPSDPSPSQNDIRKKIINSKFKRLQDHLKL